MSKRFFSSANPQRPATSSDRKTRKLKVISIADPCKVPWKSMAPQDEADTTRHCAMCDKNVYNISSMTPEETSELFATEGNVCVRLFARADGTVVQQNCKKEEKKASVRSAVKGALMGGSFAALVVSAGTLRSGDKCTTGFGGGGDEMYELAGEPMMEYEPIIDPDIVPENATEPEPVELMGDMIFVPEEEASQTDDLGLGAEEFQGQGVVYEGEGQDQ